MRDRVIKAALMVAQASFFIIIIGYILLRTQWVVLPGFIAVAILMASKCSRCGTSFKDQRVYSKFKLLKFYDTKIVDDCPVCHRPMSDG
jgi:hypothetical protein